MPVLSWPGNTMATMGRALGTQWYRGWATELPWETGQLYAAALPSAHTLERVHFGARWTGITSNCENFQELSNDFMAIGVVTQASFRGPTAPSALTHATDVDPPMERWVWWATTQMRPIVYGSAHPDVTIWGTDVTAVVGDSQGRVKANVAGGQTLDVYITWSPWSLTEWMTRGPVIGQVWYSILASF